jgi:hypothetical protein
MDSFVIYFDEVTDSLDISYFLSSKSTQDIISNKDIIPFINYSDLTAIFLLGLFSSLCAFTFCCTSKKTVPKYIVVQQEPVNDKIVSV